MFIDALDPGMAQTHIFFAVRAHCDAGNDPTTCLDERRSQDRMVLAITASTETRRGRGTPHVNTGRIAGVEEFVSFKLLFEPSRDLLGGGLVPEDGLRCGFPEVRNFPGTDQVTNRLRSNRRLDGHATTA